VKKLLAILAAGAMVLFPQVPSAAEQHGFTCTVEGAAMFKPGLNSEPQELKFVFKGELTDCQSSNSDATGGKVTAKGVVHEATCASSQAEGVAKMKWDDGTKTTLEFTTDDVAAAVFLTGTVGKSNSDTAQTGDDVLALLAFDADVTQCNTEEGITDAAFHGQVGGGSPS